MARRWWRTGLTELATRLRARSCAPPRASCRSCTPSDVEPASPACARRRWGATAARRRLRLLGHRAGAARAQRSLAGGHVLAGDRRSSPTRCRFLGRPEDGRRGNVPKLRVARANVTRNDVLPALPGRNVFSAICGKAPCGEGAAGDLIRAVVVHPPVSARAHLSDGDRRGATLAKKQSSGRDAAARSLARSAISGATCCARSIRRSRARPSVPRRAAQSAAAAALRLPPGAPRARRVGVPTAQEQAALHA